MSPVNKSLVGIAGVHHVVSELSRRGMIALPSVKNTAAYDIVAMNEAGTKHANIQVKASYKRVTAFLMPPPERIRTGKNDYFVLARWNDRDSKYECFLLTGREAQDEVRRCIKAQQQSVDAKTRKGLRPSARVGPMNAKAAERWSEAWKNWLLQPSDIKRRCLTPRSRADAP
jgi:hypothetical protein